MKNRKKHMQTNVEGRESVYMQEQTKKYWKIVAGRDGRERERKSPIPF